ncbi:MAG TPA: hypothetical protein VMU87_19630 [Stellaceae bacterium]|nr:hypothetical protein [Stellaceae bacterium]
MKQLLVVLAAVVAAVLLTQLLFEFHSWDREQSCATAGGRNCAGRPLPLDR